jgi:ParB family transcriptional regulator, chromosome partitioning protein
VASRYGLGRGLEALIPRTETEAGVIEVPVDRIARNPHQPRARFDDEELAELAASIVEHGVIQPVVVRTSPDGGYELIAGERRVRAARQAGLASVPAVVRDSSDEGVLELALVENIQRADLNAIEEAAAYRELIDRFGLTHEEVAQRVGKSRVAISNALRLLDLASETRAAIVGGAISEGHGRALAAITVPELQRAVLQVVLQRHLSVRQTEELVRRRRTLGLSRTRVPLTPDLQDLEAQLRGLLATKVGIARSRRGGRLVIEFYSDEELDRIYTIISRGTAATPSPTDEPAAPSPITIQPAPDEVQP